MDKKMAVLITDDFKDSEFTSPVDAFELTGCQVVTIERQAGKTVKGKQGGAEVAIGRAIGGITPGEFDALLLPGDCSPGQLCGDEHLVIFTRDFVNGGKPAFATCHGPQLLISADVIRGRKLMAVRPIVVDMKNTRGESYDQEVMVDDEQLVTSGTPDNLPVFNHETLHLFGAGIAPPAQLFPEAQHVIGKLDFVRTNLPYQRRQYTGYWKALDVTLAYPRLFVITQTMDLASELYTADQDHGFWLAINCTGYFCSFAGHLTAAGVLIAEQVKGHGIRVIDIKGIHAPQPVVTGDAPGDDALFTQPTASDSRSFHLSSPLCYGVRTLPQ